MTAAAEFDVIRRYFTRPADDSDVLIGVGDDAALLNVRGALVAAVDTLVAGVHFPEDIDVGAIAHRALAVNLSDLAAMGARPRWCLLALTMPEARADWLEPFAAGLFTLADRHGVALVGGDLTRGPLTVSVTLLGSVDPRMALTRAGGRAGDDIYVTGTLGDAAAGLAIVQGGATQTGGSAAALANRFLHPMPRVEAGLALAGVANAAIDISDGLAADLAHLCEASGCGASVDLERLPLSEALTELHSPRQAEALALSGGDDYELCFTASPQRADDVAAALGACGMPVTRIGRLTAGSGIAWRRDGREFEPPAAPGYTHF